MKQSNDLLCYTFFASSNDRIPSSDRQSWARILRPESSRGMASCFPASTGNVHFVLKPNKILAAELESQGQVVISSGSKSKAVAFIPDKGTVDAILLHLMINCGRIYARGPNKKALTDTPFAHLPLCRERDRDELRCRIPASAFTTFEKWTTKRMGDIEESHKELELFTQADEFQTFDIPENLSSRGSLAARDVKIAPLAKLQVNYGDFDGVLRLDGRLFRTTMYEKNIMASASAKN